MRIHPPYNIICNSAQIPDKSENICYCPSNDILSNNFNSKTTKNESIYESDQDRPNRSSCTIYHEQNQNKCNFDKEKKKFQETSNSFFTKRTIQKSNECSPCGIYIDDYIIDINNEANQKYFKEKQSPQNDSLKLACKCYNTTLKEGEEEDFRNIKEESNSICCPQSTYNSNFNNQSIVNRESLNHNWKNKKLCNVLNNDDLPCQGNECNKDNEIANMRDINTRYSPERCVAQENYRNKNMEDSVSQRDWYCGITHEGLKIRSDKDLNMFKNDSEDRLISERNTNKYSNWDNYRQISPTLAEHSRPRNISSCCGYQHIVSNTRIEGERSKQNSFKINGRSNCTNYSGKSANIFYNTNDQHTQDENISHQSQSNKECRSSQYSYKLQKINHCSNLVAVPANQLTNNYFNLMNCSDFVYVQKHSQMEKNAVCKDESHDSVSEPKCYNYTLDRSEKSIVHEMRTNQLSTNTSGKCFHLLEGEDRKRERKTEMYNSPYLIKCSSSSYENPQLFQTTQKEYNNVDGDDFCCCIIKDQNSSRHSGKGSGNQSSSLLTNNYCEQKRCDNCTNSFLSSKIDRNSEVCNNEQDCPKNSQHFYKQCHNKSCAYFRNTNNNNFGCPHSNASITLKYEQENSLTEGRKSNHIACKCNQNVKKINITNALMCNCGRHFNTRPIEDVNIQKSNLPEGQARSCSIYYPAETHAKKNNHCSCHKPKRYYKKTAPVNDVNERLLESNTTQCEEKNNNHCSCHKPKRYYKKNASVNNDASERLLDSNNIQCEDKDICQRPKNGVKSNEVKQSRLMKLCSRCCKRRRNREVDSTCYINKQTQPNEKSYTDETKCLCSCEPSENKINVGSSNDFYKPRGREIYFNLGSSSYNLRDENNILNNEHSDHYANHSNLKSNILCTCGESKRRRKGKNNNSHTRSKNDKICTCDGRDLEEFNQLTSIKSQHSFENENNVCICTRRKGSEQGRNEDDTLKCLCNGDIICSRVYNSSHMSKNDQKCTCGGYEFNERRNNKSQQNYKNDNNVTKEISQSNIKSCLCTRCGSSEREKKDDDTIKCICDVAITKLLCSCEPSEKTCNVGSCNYISVPRGHEIYFNLDSSSYNLVDENTVLNSKNSDCCVNHINQKSNILCTSNENNRQSKEVNPISKRDTICTCEGSDFEEFNQHKNNKSQRSFENDTGCKGSERETNEDDTLKCVCDGDIICNRVSLAYCYNHIDPKLGKCQCSSPCTLDNNKILDNKEILKTRRISEKCYRSDIRTYNGLKRNSYFTIGNSDIDKIKKRKMEKKEKQCQLSATRIKHFDYISTHSNTSRDCGKPFRRCNITFQYSKELKRKSARVMPYIHDKYSKQKSNRQISHQTIAREPTKSARTSCSQCGFCKKKTHTRE
ncbi:homeobox protein 2-like isoform X2 [Scaptodrosophila lebanonensis]|nr:homeobox protein 2-like isoform X2 [Scaptodrosophila lebanonensis]